MKKNFFLVIILPIVVQLFIINIVKIIRDETLYYTMYVLFWLLYFPYFYWLKNSIHFLYQHSKRQQDFKMRNFKIGILIILLWLLNFVLFVAYVFAFVFNIYLEKEPNLDVIMCFAVIGFIGPISSFYTGYFMYRLIKSIDLKEDFNMADFIGNFIFYSFPPLAFWVIEKKIKAILSDENNVIR